MYCPCWLLFSSIEMRFEWICYLTYFCTFACVNICFPMSLLIVLSYIFDFTVCYKFVPEAIKQTLKPWHMVKVTRQGLSHRCGGVCVFWMLLVWNGFFVFVCLFLHLHEIMDGLYFHCSLSVCLSVCVCVWLFLWTNGWTDLDAVFTERLLSTLTRTLLKLVTLDQMSRSQWPKIIFFIIVY